MRKRKFFREFSCNWTKLKEMQRHIIVCNGMLLSSSLSNFSPFPISALLLQLSVPIHCQNTLRCAKRAHATWCSETKTLPPAVERWFVMAALAEEGPVVALTLAQSISSPAVSQLFFDCPQSAYHKMQYPHLLWLENEH